MATVRLFPANWRSSQWRGIPWTSPEKATQDNGVGASASTPTAINWTALTSVNTSSQTSITLFVPAGTVNGNVMYTFLVATASSGSPIFTPAAGWTLIAATTRNFLAVRTYHRIAQDEPSAGYIWSVDNISTIIGECVTFTGVDGASPEDVATVTTSSATSPQTPPITPVTDKTWVLSFVGGDATTVGTAPANMTVIDTIADSIAKNLGIAETLVSPAGTFTPGAWTGVAGPTSGSAGHTIALRPGQPTSIWRSYDGSVIPDGATITAVAIAWKAKVTAGNGTVFTLSGRGWRGLVQQPQGQGDTHIDNAVVADGTFKTGSMDITSWRSWVTSDFLAPANLEIEMAASSNDSVGLAAWTLDYVALDVTYTDPPAQTWGPLTDINATEDTGTFAAAVEDTWTINDGISSFAMTYAAAPAEPSSVRFWGGLASMLLGILSGSGPTQYLQSFAAAFTPAGSLIRQTGKVLGGGFTPTGALVRQAGKVLSGSLAPAGSLIKQTSKVLSGSFTPAGSLIRQTGKVLSAAITPSGALTVNEIFSRVFAASFSPSGSLVRETNKVLSAALTPSGSLLKETSKFFAATLTLAGDALVILVHIYFVTLAAGLTLSAAVSLETGKVLSGQLTPGAAFVKQAGKNFIAAITPTGAITAFRIFNRAFSAGLTITGALGPKTITKVFAGWIIPRGEWWDGDFWHEGLNRETTKALSAAIRPVGLLNRFITKVPFTGSMTPTGALVTNHGFAKTFAAALTLSSTLSRQVGKTLSGSIATNGLLSRQTAKVLAGALTPAGAAIARTYDFVRTRFTAGLTPSGSTPVKVVTKVMAASIVPSGLLNRLTSRGFAANLGMSANLSKVTTRTFGAALTLVAGLVRETGKALTGGFTPTGALGPRVISKTFAAVVVPVGRLVKESSRTFAGAMTPGGGLVKAAGKLFTAGLSPVGTFGPKTVTKALNATLAPTGTLNRFTTKVPFMASLTLVGALRYTRANVSGFPEYTCYFEWETEYVSA